MGDNQDQWPRPRKESAIARIVTWLTVGEGLGLEGELFSVFRTEIGREAEWVKLFREKGGKKHR